VAKRKVLPENLGVTALRRQNFSDSGKKTFSDLSLNKAAAGKMSDLQPLSRRISETVRDMAKIAIHH